MFLICKESETQMRQIATAAVLATAWLAFSVLATGQTPRPTPAPRSAVAPAAAPYFPDRFEWQHKKPDDVGMDPLRLDEAVKFAIANENPANRDLNLTLATTFGRSEPFDTPIGPVKARAPASGLITRHGYIVAEWGEPKRVDMTYSVTKTFLTTVVGLAWQRGLIRDVNDYARDYMPPDVDLFEAAHNQKIKWDHLLRQTSDWQGHAVGQAGLGGSPGRRQAGRLAEPQAVRAGHALQVQRRARERHGAGGAAGLAPAAAGRAARGNDGADRRLVDVALVRLRKFLGRARRAEECSR